VEDRASGIQLIQELVSEGLHGITKYSSSLDKVMRMHSVTSTIENGFVHLPDNAAWLTEYLHELSVFPNGRYDDMVDSTSQALDWIKINGRKDGSGLYGYYVMKMQEQEEARSTASSPPTCPTCGVPMTQRVSGVWRCQQCGAQSSPKGNPPRSFNRKDFFARNDILRRKFRWGR
jgi:ribosomal protein L37AE/L43A